MNRISFPWKLISRAVAKAHGFLDPISLLTQLGKFSQPSEVAEPIELIRAGVIFHARGLINSRVIQHNLDWVWPYWVERQFDPHDESFVPRAFSITHVNLTHRNWTAIGIPDCDELPIVDPRGLVTPFWDKWSIDAWIVTQYNDFLIPSKAKHCEQREDYDSGLAIETITRSSGLELTSRAEMLDLGGKPVCGIRLNASSDVGGWLIVSLRPYNPEGVSIINSAELSADRKSWRIGNNDTVHFSEPVERSHFSTYRSGDIYIHLAETEEQTTAQCNIGMVTAAAMFELQPNANRLIELQIPFSKTKSKQVFDDVQMPNRDVWKLALHDSCQLNIPIGQFQQLYDNAVRTLILCAPDDIYPGPYTYKRFWYRDASFIAYGLLCAGLVDRAEKALCNFPKRQDRSGYFHSQEGEWDSNGQVLWILLRFHNLTGRLPNGVDWYPIIRRGANWIINKRLSDDEESGHAGLLPAGFSAEHLGPNDFYYWDDFWAIAGMRAAAEFATLFEQASDRVLFEREATSLSAAVERSLDKAAGRIQNNAMPASPSRRLDAGAIGSLAAGYPLQLFEPNDPRLIESVDFLLNNCCVKGGFFQDMIHSGINPYLTLHIAQVLLRAGDSRANTLLETVADLASPTGQWPEAIHPITGGGCMGDGHHAWAAAEWIIMLRNCFVREEDQDLVLCAGISPKWIVSNESLNFGPTLTAFGAIEVEVEALDGQVRVEWDATWQCPPRNILIQLPGFIHQQVSAQCRSITMNRLAL